VFDWDFIGNDLSKNRVRASFVVFFWNESLMSS
jgi:hypothetical protein